jgi:hypothetical protein
MSDLILTEEDIDNVLGPDAKKFKEVMLLVEDMIDFPQQYHGSKALVTALQLSAYRTKIGETANWLKSQEKSLNGRRKKDLLISMENNLLENINVLKLMGRIDGKAAGIL